MYDSLIIFIVIILAVSLIGSSFLLLYVFYKKKGDATEEKYATSASVQAAYTKQSGSKAWLYTIIFWPLFCLVLSGIILYLSFHKTPYLYAGDITLIFISLIFFFIGMGLLHKPINRKRQATNTAIATVINVERKKGHSGKGSQRNYISQYQFHAEGAMHNVSSKFTCSTCLIKKDQEIKLYYVPKQPHIIYVHEEVKERCFGARILCGMGILCPLIVIAAPWLRPILG